MNILHLISILFEGLVALLGVKLALIKKKTYGWGIALTFAIYVFYDLSKYFVFNFNPDLLYVIFFIATVSIFLAVWQIFKEK
ncbi:hypothetical protein GYA19_01725 [Candidatus Beckwithbacteria bacterium]|nr:hypothetical protein [Candidatus Beckwithbacteria bacterium]